MSGAVFGNGPGLASPAGPPGNEAQVASERERKRLRGPRDGFDDLLGELGNVAAASARPPVPTPVTALLDDGAVKPPSTDGVAAGNASPTAVGGGKPPPVAVARPEQRADCSDPRNAERKNDGAAASVPLRHPLARQIESLTVTGQGGVASCEAANVEAQATRPRPETESHLSRDDSARTTDTSTKDLGAAVLSARRQVGREGVKQIDLQVDSAVMSMLQRPRLALAEKASTPAPPPAPEFNGNNSLPFDGPDVGAALASHLGQLLASGGHEAVVRLAPDEFGVLEVRVTLRDGQVNVAFGAAVARTRAVLEQALPQLRDLLGAAGLRLNDASIVSQLARAAERPVALASRASLAEPPGGSAEAGSRPSGSRRSKRTDVDLYA